jgi:hypothetical protein
MIPPEKRDVTLEDLLRLKRAERPPPEFWAKFDADMRAKQLSAIVGRPRWSGVSAFLGLLGRFQLPIGAAAALALAYVGYTRFESAPPAPVAVAPVRSVKPAPAAGLAAVEKPAAAEPKPEAAAPVSASLVAAVPAPVVTATSPHLVSVPVVLPPAAPAAHSPFADGLAVTLADYREPTAAAHAAAFGSDSEFEIVPTRAAAVAEPLARMDPTEERRSRLLDSSLSNSRTMVSDWIRNRASSDDRMAESLEHASDHLLTGIRF